MERKKAEPRATSDEKPHQTSSFLVALGASSGGLDPLQEFFRHMPGVTGMAFMIIQHLSSQGKSMHGDLLQKHTPMKIATVEDAMKVEPNRVSLRQNYTATPGGRSKMTETPHLRIPTISTRLLDIPLGYSYAVTGESTADSAP